MLDHQQRVAQVAEFLQGVEQPAVVAGVQADRRLVEHVEHAAQPAAHLGRQANALHFAAGKRGGGPGERQIVQAHVDQELQPVANLAGHLAGDLPLAVVELPVLELVQQPAQRQAAELVDRAAAEPHGRGVVAQPAAAADRALDLVDQMLQLRAEGGRDAARLFQRRIETLVLEAEAHVANPRRTGSRPCTPARRRGLHVEPLLAGAVEDQPAVAAAELRRRARRSECPCRAKTPPASRANSRLAGAGPQRHGALGQRELRIARAARPDWCRFARPALRRPGTSPRRC